jgi:hypothetical protein
MACHIQIGDDPTIWWLAEQIQPSQLTQPLGVTTWYPIRGCLVLSPRASHVAIFTPAPVLVPDPVPGPAVGIYLPTAAGVSAGHAGYELAGGDPDVLAEQIQTLMRNGQSQTITLGAAGGTLVLNGATLTFAVLAPIGVVGGATPHG